MFVLMACHDWTTLTPLEPNRLEANPLETNRLEAGPFEPNRSRCRNLRVKRPGLAQWPPLWGSGDECTFLGGVGYLGGGRPPLEK
jgi:hypothetical protein